MAARVAVANPAGQAIFYTGKLARDNRLRRQ